MTLVEVLVVVSIIAVMASLTIHAVQSAWQAGRSAVCLVHVKQINTGLLAAATEHDQRLVADRDLSRGGGVFDAISPNSWADLLHWDGYVHAKAMQCPSDDSPLARPDRRRRSYAINGYLYAWNPDRWPSGPTPHLDRDIAHPARSLALVDGAEQGYRIAGLWSEVAGGLVRHDQAASYAFLDGHAKSIRFADMFGIDPNSRPYPEQIGPLLREATGHDDPWHGAGADFAEYFPPWAPWTRR